MSWSRKSNQLSCIEAKKNITADARMCEVVVVSSISYVGLSIKLNIFLIDYPLLTNNMLLSRNISALFVSLIILQYVKISFMLAVHPWWGFWMMLLNLVIVLRLKIDKNEQVETFNVARNDRQSHPSRSTFTVASINLSYYVFQKQSHLIMRSVSTHRNWYIIYP